MEFDRIRIWLLTGGAVLALAACQSGKPPASADSGLAAIAGGAISAAPLDSQALSLDAGQPVAPAAPAALPNNNIEAPDVFSVTDEALWDGRPSLGGVWVASPDVVDPERVIMRNPANGRFVIGALFRRERDNPGPLLQISSDAAEALGLLAGQPAMIEVTALRRQASATEQTTAAAPTEAPAPDADADADADITDIAAAAIQNATAPAAADGGGLIQVGIFSVEANAQRAVQMLAQAGIAASVSSEAAQGKTFWSVTARGDGAVLEAIRGAGFADAYLLKR
ncbi:MAG: SPOR domain-containing protein [Paracoccaceae bacterium]